MLGVKETHHHSNNGKKINFSKFYLFKVINPSLTKFADTITFLTTVRNIYNNCNVEKSRE